MCILMSVRMLVLCVMSLFCCQYLVFIQILHKSRRKVEFIDGNYGTNRAFLGGDIRVSLLFD